MTNKPVYVLTNRHKDKALQLAEDFFTAGQEQWCMAMLCLAARGTCFYTTPTKLLTSLARILHNINHINLSTN